MSESLKNSLVPRPNVHFTPEIGWINDPNGLVFCNGEYHLFYQYHPHGTLWGPMHWGHAVSRDLLTWQHLPIALAPDAHGTIFSGSAVVDEHNTAGFGAGAMVAIFTHHNGEGTPRQTQSLAYSIDAGRTWIKYALNPVLIPPDGTPDFRDPKVFWHGNGTNGRWVMALAVATEIRFYTSPNLKDWSESGRFGEAFGSHAGVWECPELVPLEIEDSPVRERRWALIVSVNKGAPAGGSGVQYFIGQFDGRTFLCDDPPGRVRWADYGADFYAPQAWNGSPDGRTYWIAWMNNWSYGRQIPDFGGRRGAMTLPRELMLRRDGGDLVLVQRPVHALERAGLEVARIINRTLNDEAVVLHTGAELFERACDLRVSFALPAASQVENFGIRFVAANGRSITLRYVVERGAFELDRTACPSEIPGFATSHCAILKLHNGRLALQVVVDQTSIELFAENGTLTVTDQYFLDSPLVTVEAFAKAGAVTLESATLRTIGRPDS